MNTTDAIAILPWCGIAEKVGGKVTRVSVPSRPLWTNGERGAARMASVAITRKETGVCLDCRICGDGDAAEPERCKDMEKALCYHSLAAAMVAAGEYGTMYFPADPQAFAVGKPGAKLVTLRAAYASPGLAPAATVVVVVPRPGSKAKVTPAVSTSPGLAPSTHCPCGTTLEAGQMESGLCTACDKSTPVAPLPVTIKAPRKRKVAR